MNDVHKHVAKNMYVMMSLERSQFSLQIVGVRRLPVIGAPQDLDRDYSAGWPIATPEDHTIFTCAYAKHQSCSHYRYQELTTDGCLSLRHNSNCHQHQMSEDVSMFLKLLN